MKIVQVTNRTRNNRLIGKHVEIVDDFWSRLRWISGRKYLPTGGGLLIVRTVWMHTSMLPFPVDVVNLDINHRVLAIRRGLPPFRAGAIRLNTFMMLELPLGTIDKSGLHLQDELDIRPSEGSYSFSEVEHVKI